jgi:hypothetical protein
MRADAIRRLKAELGKDTPSDVALAKLWLGLVSDGIRWKNADQVERCQYRRRSYAGAP